MSDLRLRPSTIGEAKLFVKEFHSHLPNVVGGLWAIACEEDGRLCGVAIVGRPVSRVLASVGCLELTRVCTDRTPNVSSKLASACWRAARAMGCQRMVTYTLESESGTTYRAAGFRDMGITTKGGRKWGGGKRSNRDHNRSEQVILMPKRRWEARKVWVDE